MRSDFYVYVLFRHDTGAPFYVGKGCGRRWKRSENDNGNPYKSRIVAAARRAGREVPKVIVQQGLTKDAALAAEVELIAAIGRQRLANLTDGGDDPPIRTLPHTPETIEKMKATARGRKPHPATIAAMVAARKGKPQSAETIRKRTAHRKGVPQSPAHRQAIAAALKGRRPDLRTVQAKAEYDRRRHAALFPTKACEVCGTGFVAAPSHREQRFCGKSCSGKFNQARRNASEDHSG